MFRTPPGPSSGGTTVFTRHLVLIILYGWLTGVQDAPSWFHVQDYIEMHGRQNIKSETVNKLRKKR